MGTSQADDRLKAMNTTSAIAAVAILMVSTAVTSHACQIAPAPEPIGPAVTQPAQIDAQQIADAITAARSRHTFTWLGLSEADAQTQAGAQGVAFRVIRRDGVDLPQTRDLRPGRINATVAGGLVIGIAVEPAHTTVEGTSDIRGLPLLGLAIDAAQAHATANGTTLRVVSVDGQSMAVTADYNPDRMNATVLGGVVVAISAG